jgi:hypothetical protein
MTPPPNPRDLREEGRGEARRERRQVSGRGWEGWDDGDQRRFFITDTGISPFQSIYGTAGYAEARMDRLKGVKNQSGQMYFLQD